MTSKHAEQEYDELAAVYDERWRHYVDASVRRTAEALRLNGDERILDVGCGTGALLHDLQRRYPRLHLNGVDPSAEMLKLARQKCGDSIVLKKGAAGDLPYPDGSFDVVVNVSALHFFPDARQALSEMVRVVRPGGRITVTDWCADFLSMRLLAAWLRLRRAPLGRIYRLGELKQLLQSADLEIEEATHFRIRPLWGMMLVSGTRSLKTGSL